MQKLVNFRDLGHLKTRDGRQLKTAKLLRSGEVVAIGTEDTQRLVHDYQLKTIADFRGDEEISEKPDDAILGVTYHQIDIMKAVQENSSQKNLMHNLNPKMAHAHMMEIYEHLVRNSGAQSGYRTFLDLALAQDDGALLFHCFAGKDRTGIGAALLLKLLDVSTDDIVKDYLETNEMRAEANEKLVFDAKKQGLPQDGLDALNILMSVDEGYLRHSMQIIDKEYDGFDAYAEQKLNVDEHQRQQLKKIYLEP